MIDPAIKRGSSELVVLSVLARESLHGYELARRIDTQTSGLLSFTLASLYPLLYRLERRGCVTGVWKKAPSGRERRYYRITRLGRRQLVPLREEWSRYVRALRRLPGFRSA
jgi:DNA-binding PadR family transcriptional regulator